MKFRIRCSAIGSIMGGHVGLSETQKAKRLELENREKPHTDNMLQEYAVIMDKFDNPELPAGTKTYCQQWLKEQIYKRRKDIHSKYLDKGNFCEDWSIDFINTQLLTEYTKNEEYFENEWLSGTPDIKADKIIDVKNSYDFHTFPLFDTKIENKDYEYQLQGYMDLTGIKSASLVYTLNDLPHHLIEREARSMAWREGGQWEDYFDDAKERFTYPDIEDKYKIKFFETEYDPDVIGRIIQRVRLCRKYINTLLEQSK